MICKDSGAVNMSKRVERIFELNRSELSLLGLISYIGLSSIRNQLAAGVIPPEDIPTVEHMIVDAEPLVERIRELIDGYLERVEKEEAVEMGVPSIVSIPPARVQ